MDAAFVRVCNIILHIRLYLPWIVAPHCCCALLLCTVSVRKQANFSVILHIFLTQTWTQSLITLTLARRAMRSKTRWMISACSHPKRSTCSTTLFALKRWAIKSLLHVLVVQKQLEPASYVPRLPNYNRSNTQRPPHRSGTFLLTNPKIDYNNPPTDHGCYRQKRGRAALAAAGAATQVLWWMRRTGWTRTRVMKRQL